MNTQLTPIIEDSFLQYSGAVLQSRALADVRDLNKPSARQIFYCMYTDKFVHDKPFQKTLKAIGSSFRVYIHGDSSVEGVIMRSAQPFAMRYPLVEVEGSYGTLIEAGSWAAPRYTASRLSELSNYLFTDIDKDVISEWRDNYDNTEQYPMVLPSKGFYNLVNGSYGIGSGASSSIPQYNLRELNAALIKLLNNPNIPFENIYCAPDFATGGILLNGKEVMESHRKGTGKACKLRGVINYNTKERCLIVTELPYMVYTNTICKQLEEIINGDDNFGIERFNDLTGKTPLIKIYISKDANPSIVMDLLFKKTSLETYYGVNFTLLENGRFPKVFGWKEILQAHLDHEKEVYRRGYEYDKNKINKRLHIIEGMSKAIANIEEVILTIKQSTSTAAANKALQQLLNIDEEQAKAILAIKLSSLAKLEVEKYEKEKAELEAKLAQINEILSNEKLFNSKIEEGLREVAKKFGDDRRTQVINWRDTEEAIDIAAIVTDSQVKAIEYSKLPNSNKGTVGKILCDDNIKDIVGCNTRDTLIALDKNSKLFSFNAAMIPIVETPKEVGRDINSLVECGEIVKIAKFENKKYLITITKNGMIKKSETAEYKFRNDTAMKVKEDDTIVDFFFANDEDTLNMISQERFRQIKVSDLVNNSKLTQGRKLGDVDAKYAILSPLDDLIFYTDDGICNKVKSSDLKTKNKKLNYTNIIDSKNMLFCLGDKNKYIVVNSDKILSHKMDADGSTLYKGVLKRIWSL